MRNVLIVDEWHATPSLAYPFHLLLCLLGGSLVLTSVETPWTLILIRTTSSLALGPTQTLCRCGLWDGEGEWHCLCGCACMHCDAIFCYFVRFGTLLVASS